MDCWWALQIGLGSVARAGGFRVSRDPLSGPVLPGHLVQEGAGGQAVSVCTEAGPQVDAGPSWVKKQETLFHLFCCSKVCEE